MTTDTAPRPYRLDVHPTGCSGEGLADDVRRGFASSARTLPPKHFYDERGSDLFEEITRLPVAAMLDDDDVLLMGTDLADDPERIRAAYDDAAGVTAEFNLNVLRVINRELDGDFDLDRFEHVAVYDPGPPWIEMRLRSRAAQSVEIRGLGMHLAEGEEIRTEISCRFTHESVEAMYADAGLRLIVWHVDPRGWFAVSVATRA